MKFKQNVFAIVFYTFISVFSFFLFFYLSLSWSFVYRMLFSIISTVFLVGGVFLIKKIRFSFYNQFLEKRIFFKLLNFTITLVFLYFILYSYRLPLYYYIFFLILTILFTFSKYSSLYFISIYLISWIFVSFQFFSVIQEVSLIWIEKKTSIWQQVQKEIQWTIEKNDHYVITIQKRNIDSKKVIIILPKEIHFIEHKDFDFPFVFSIKLESKELPMFSSFIIPIDYSLELLDLRFRAILEKLKTNDSIEEYQKEQINFFKDIMERKNPDIEIIGNFYSYFDKFYADYIQNGFYALRYENYYIIFWIREKKNVGFPHDVWILDILKNNIKLEYTSP